MLLFREENLRPLGAYYPVPYQVHAVILKKLADYKPRAVFIDFAFIDDRLEDDDEFKDSLCVLRKHAKVFLAVPAGEAQTQVQAHLLQCAEPASAAMRGFEGVNNALTYPTGVWRNGKFLPSAAFAVADKLALDPAKESDLEIIWGNAIARLNTTWMNCPSRTLWDGIRAFMHDGPPATRQRCPYTRTITVEQLLNSPEPEEVAKAIGGKAVFYGGGFKFSGDVVDPPTHVALPRVYLHAMAYDNLVYFKEHYKRTERNSVLGYCLDAAVVLIVALFLARRDTKWHKLHDSLQRFVHRFLVVIHLADADANRNGLNDLMERVAWTWLMLLVGLLGFAVAALTRGVDDGLLVLLLVYCLYRMPDPGFLMLAALLAITAPIGYFVFDLGPRNILMFAIFFELAKRVQDRLDEQANEYFDSKKRYDEAPARGWQRIAEWVWKPYRHEPGLQQPKSAEARTNEMEGSHEPRYQIGT